MNDASALLERFRKGEARSKRHREEMMQLVEMPKNDEKKRKSFSKDVREIQSSIDKLKEHWPKGTVGRKIVKRFAYYLISEMSEYHEDMISTDGLNAFIYVIENHLSEWSYSSNYIPGVEACPNLTIKLDPKRKTDPKKSFEQVKEMLTHTNVPLNKWILYFDVSEPDDYDTFGSSITIKNILN